MGVIYDVHHVTYIMSCHKAIVVITGRAHCLHDYIVFILRVRSFKPLGLWQFIVKFGTAPINAKTFFYEGSSTCIIKDISI